MTAGVLRGQEGIEDGFLAGDGPLVGYAFPTHEGPGAQKEMPQRERPTIDDLAHKAEQTGSRQSFTFEGPHDVVMFIAEPVRESVGGTQQVTGAAWLMQRLPEINRGRSQQLLFVSLGFGAAALMTGFLAWFVTVEVSGGVSTVTNRLAALEGDLARPAGVANRPQLAEFERILTGINAMASSLQEQILTQQNLQEQLRHRERLSALGQFAAGVAHELRNPLATIRLRAQMSQHAPNQETLARNSGVILEEVDRLDAMIGRLLYFARPISLDLQRLNVAELCSDVIRSWQARSPDSIRLRCDSAGRIEVLADRSRLLQVLDNLVENAIQATRGAPGEVVLRATEHLNRVRIEVLDQGPGFSPEALKHAFDPFYTTKETGTGLGLSIAFELVEAHGGTLLAASRPGGGATVSVTLPQQGPTKEKE
ncbi:MAG: two-component system sensor histidine kinase NtrB [Janthinobacterium lividum]